jgi:hypothetical protein
VWLIVWAGISEGCKPRQQTLPISPLFGRTTLKSDWKSPISAKFFINPDKKSWDWFVLMLYHDCHEGFAVFPANRTSGFPSFQIFVKCSQSPKRRYLRSLWLFHVVSMNSYWNHSCVSPVMTQGSSKSDIEKACTRWNQVTLCSHS